MFQCLDFNALLNIQAFNCVENESGADICSNKTGCLACLFISLFLGHHGNTLEGLHVFVWKG